MMQTADQIPATDPLIESDRESTKSETDSAEPAAPSSPVKKQGMFIWNSAYEKWHECLVECSPPSLHITEYEDQGLDVNECQLQHLTENWYHGTLSRREARVILQDFNGGDGSFLVRTSESFKGKYAVSFVHESSVKHVVIETKEDPVTGILYHITPNGPVFSSLYELVEEAQQTPLIQNHVFNVQLTCSPPKPDTSWLHAGVKSLSQAEQVLRKEHRDGAFFVYRTQSEYAPYIVAYRSNGSILHNLIVYTNQSNGGYTLNNVTSQVLYKVIHYFMENPINGKTVLRYPIPDRSSKSTNCGIALKDWIGDREMNELSFSYGSLVRNIHDKSTEWSIGDHRGDKQKYFKRSHVRLLTRDELAFINSLKAESLASASQSQLPDSSSDAINNNDQQKQQHSSSSSSDDNNNSNNSGDNNSTEHSHSIDLCHHSNVRVELMETGQHGCVLLIETDEGCSRQAKEYKLSCSSEQDLESWHHFLQKASTSSNFSSKFQHTTLKSSSNSQTSKSPKLSRCTVS